MIKVLFLTVGPKISSSTRVRVFQYLKYFRHDGFRCKVIVPVNFSRLYKKTGLLKKFNKFSYQLYWLNIFFHAFLNDVIFIQKIIPTQSKLNLLKKINSKIIYDLDDAIYTACTARKNVSKNKVKKRKENLINVLKIARQIIVSNEYLKKFVIEYNKNVTIIPTVVDTNQYVLKNYEQRNDKIILGYSCSPGNLFYLAQIKNVLQTISRKYPNVYLKVVSSQPFKLDGVRIINEKFSLENHIQNLQGFDIGLEPLTDDEWTRAKAGFKGIEYMACGVPVVASPVGVNTKKIRNGINGFLANSDEEWIKKLSILINSRELREKIGKEGRKTVEKRYSLNTTLPELEEIIKQVARQNSH